MNRIIIALVFSIVLVFTGWDTATEAEFPSSGVGSTIKASTTDNITVSSEMGIFEFKPQYSYHAETQKIAHKELLSVKLKMSSNPEIYFRSL